MNKVIAHTYWFMAGRWSGERPKIVETAWLTSILPPFYRGIGVQLRVGPWSVRLGVCYPRMPVTVDDYAYIDDMKENLEALAGFELEDEEIRTWAGSRRKPERATTPESSDASSPDSGTETSST